MIMDFEWATVKEQANKERYGISFDEVIELFQRSIDFLEMYDAEHSGDEDRFIAIGPVRLGVVAVVYTERQCTAGHNLGNPPLQAVHGR